VLYPRIIGSGIHLHPLAVILAILAGHELAGVAGIFLAIPVIAILTVSHRHWLEHRGSTGLVADILKPAEQAVNEPAPEEGPRAEAMEDEVDRAVETGEQEEQRRRGSGAGPAPEPAVTK
jgi:hypothetical protein